MSKPTHTPGPWRRQRTVFGGTEVLADVSGQVVQIAVVDTGGLALNRDRVAWADADLIVAAPDLLAELRATADWLEERADAAAAIAGGFGGKVKVHQDARDVAAGEAARLRGRAGLIRLVAGKAEGGAG